MSYPFRVYYCEKCREGYLVLQTDPELHLLKKSMRCPNASVCESKQAQRRKEDVPVEKFGKITARQFFQACMGVGLPGERKCGLDEVTELLVGANIVGLQLEPAPDPNRSIIKAIELDNGKVIHVASSPLGATFYKVTNKEMKHVR